MGNCVSTQPHTPFTRPSLSDGHDTSSSPSYGPVTFIITCPSLTPFQYPPLWLFECRLNLGPVCLGQQVALYHRAEDCFNPDPLSVPVAEDWLDKVTECTPHWQTFQIADRQGREVALLRVPNYNPICFPHEQGIQSFGATLDMADKEATNPP